MTARDAMLSRLRRRRPDTALERDFYTSAEDFKIDLDMIPHQITPVIELSSNTLFPWNLVKARRTI